MEAHTTLEMLACMERNPKIELESRILSSNGKNLVYQKMDSKMLSESFKKNKDVDFRMMEEDDGFALSDGTSFQEWNNWSGFYSTTRRSIF